MRLRGTMTRGVRGFPSWSELSRSSCPTLLVSQLFSKVWSRSDFLNRLWERCERSLSLSLFLSLLQSPKLWIFLTPELRLFAISLLIYLVDGASHYVWHVNTIGAISPPRSFTPFPSPEAISRGEMIMVYPSPDHLPSPNSSNIPISPYPLNGQPCIPILVVTSADEGAAIVPQASRRMMRRSVSAAANRDMLVPDSRCPGPRENSLSV
jgi:hypothetical protein